MKQSNSPFVYPIERTGRFFNSEATKGAARAFVYRAAERGELEIVKVGIRAAAVTRESILRFAESRSIPLPADF